MSPFRVIVIVNEIVIAIFKQGVHSAYADFQWSPENNIHAEIYTKTTYNKYTIQKLEIHLQILERGHKKLIMLLVLFLVIFCCAITIQFYIH